MGNKCLDKQKGWGGGSQERFESVGILKSCLRVPEQHGVELGMDEEREGTKVREKAKRLG